MDVTATATSTSSVQGGSSMHEAEPGEVTFAVHEVTPLPWEEEPVSLHESLLRCLRSSDTFHPEVIAISHADSSVLPMPSKNGLLAAVHLAFGRHRPLRLSPDMIWLAILQGFARHVSIHAKALEHRMMKAPGKHTIELQIEGDFDWPEVFAQFCTALEHHAAGEIEGLKADFSTTGPVEQAACQVALMDVFSPYVQYTLACICGIPSVTLEGCTADWQRLHGKLVLLRGYDADDWIEELDEIIAQFVRAATGAADVGWWQQIYKLTPQYGAEIVEGWLSAFFPYLKADDESFTRRRVRGEAISTRVVPPGISQVGIKLASPSGTERLTLVSGLIAVDDLNEKGVRPRIGWAVVRSPFMERFVTELRNQPGIKTRPPSPFDFDIASPYGPRAMIMLPVDLRMFYEVTDGADLFGRGTLHPLRMLLGPSPCGSWRQLGQWEDGSFLVENDAIVRLQWKQGQWEHQTLALTFSDFMARMIASSGQPYWQDPAFVEPQITPHWNRFECPKPYLTDVGGMIAKLRKENHRLRSMKLRERDIFVIAPVTDFSVDHLPETLKQFYQACGGVEHESGLELWNAERAAPVPGTQERWYEIGSLGSFRLLLDVAADRGVIAIERSTGNRTFVEHSIPCFLEALQMRSRDRQSMVDPHLAENWIRSPYSEHAGNCFWPDETVPDAEAGAGH